MIKKTRSTHFVCFISKTFKTLKVKILYSTKNFENIAEINHETVKKNTTAQPHPRSCEKKKSKL